MDIKHAAYGKRVTAVNHAAVSGNNTDIRLIAVKMLPQDLTEETVFF